MVATWSRRSHGWRAAQLSIFGFLSVLLDRLMFRVHVVQFSGDSYWLRESFKGQEVVR